MSFGSLCTCERDEKRTLKNSPCVRVLSPTVASCIIIGYQAGSQGFSLDVVPPGYQIQSA